MIAEWSLNGNWKWLLRSSRRDLLVVRAAIYSQVSRVALERNLFASEPTAQCVGIKRKLGDNKKNFYCNLPNSRQHLAYKGTIKGYHPNLLFFIRIFLLIKQISMKQNCSFSALGECSEPRLSLAEILDRILQKPESPRRVNRLPDGNASTAQNPQECVSPREIKTNSQLTKTKQSCLKSALISFYNCVWPLSVRSSSQKHPCPIIQFFSLF